MTRIDLIKSKEFWVEYLENSKYNNTSIDNMAVEISELMEEAFLLGSSRIGVPKMKNPPQPPAKSVSNEKCDCKYPIFRGYGDEEYCGLCNRYFD